MSVWARIVAQYPALGFPVYRRYWLASLASVGGWQISAMGMAWLMFEISASTRDLGILGGATAVPAIALTLVGGVIADRFDKRVVLTWTTAMTAALLFLLALLDFLEIITVWQIWLIAAGISFVSGIDWPTRQAFFVHLIDRDGLMSAVALNSVQWQFTRMVLPALGGLMLAWYDSWLVFAIAGLGYVVMLWVIVTLAQKMPGTRSASPLTQTLEGIRFIAEQPLFRDLILLSFCTTLLLNAHMQLMPAFAKLLEAGPKGFGMLMSATGVGSIAGTLMVAAVAKGDVYGRVMLGAALAAVVMLYGFAAATFVPSYALGLLFVLLAGAGISIFLVLSTTSLQAEVPDEMRGRVMGIHGITYSLMSLGALVMGTLAEVIGTANALMVCIGVYALILGFLSLRGPTLRDLAEPAGSG